MDVLQQVLALNELMLDCSLTICHVSDAFSNLISKNESNITNRKLSEFLDITDSEYLLSLLSDNNIMSLDIKLSFPEGKQPNRVFTLGFERIIVQGKSFILLKKAKKEGNSMAMSNAFFEHSALTQFIVEPSSLSILHSNLMAKNKLAHIISSESKLSLSNIFNLPLKPLHALFNNVSAVDSTVISAPLFNAQGRNDNVNVQINSIDFNSEGVFLVQILNDVAHDDIMQDYDTAKELTNALFETKDYALLMMDSFGVINQINNTMCALLNITRDKVIGQRAKTVLPPQISTLISTSESSQHKVNFNNLSQPYRLKQQPLRNDKGYVLGLLLELKSTEDDEQGLISRAYEAANHASNHAIFITDKRGCIMHVNTMFEHQTGYRKDAIVGQNFSIITSERSNDDIVQNLWKTINNKDTWRGILKSQRQSGVSYWSDLTLKPLIDNAGNIECFVGLSHDITLQKEMQKSGTYLANYDVRTGLANSILAKDRLEGMIGRARRRKLIVAVVYLDIMQINNIATQFDEEVADSVLLMYCKNLQQALRSEDAVARMSNDRLAILLPDLPNVESLDVVSAKIDKVNQKSINVGDQSFQFDIRQGVSYYPDQGLDCESLLKNAEASIIKAWSTGAPIGCFSQGQNDNALMHFQMRREIDLMIANKTFDIIYQPIINLDNDSLYAVEAKICWQHDEYGQIENDDVYAVAEASGCAQELGLLVLEQVCIDANYWKIQGLGDINLAVNLSHGQLRDTDVPDRFSDILHRYDIDIQRFSLEIPLSYIATQWLNLDEILQQFALLGFTLEYDKFGDRGAYISDLRNFPFSGIKLTQNYISNIENDVSTANLVEGIVSMASSLNLTATADGVTEFTQILQLQEMGCNRAQGDFLAPFTDRHGVLRFVQQGIAI